MGAVDTLTAAVDHDPDGTPVIVLAGQLDLATAEIAQRALAKVPTAGGAAGRDGSAGDVVFDMTDLTFMDSSGLTVLLTAVSTGHAVRVRRPTNVIRRIIATTGLSEILPIEP